MSDTTNATARTRPPDPLLQPLQIRNLRLRNRVMSTSHASTLDDGGLPKERYQRYHEEKAKGGLALTMFGGSSMVSRDSSWGGGQINLAAGEIIPYLQQFSGRIHRHGAAIMCQMSHLGWRADAFSTNWLPTIAPSRIRETRHRNIPREMDRSDIDRVVREYAEAAWRCKEGGLDGVETVTGGHLIGQFFSPRTNRRNDAFGGSTANRARFALMVHEAIRLRVGDDFLSASASSWTKASRTASTSTNASASRACSRAPGISTSSTASTGGRTPTWHSPSTTCPACRSR
jgi:2,4-dienoyl-CoA reductase-like NADH-dependent reductase (Old Yellow Enzyme family)